MTASELKISNIHLKMSKLRQMVLAVSTLDEKVTVLSRLKAAREELMNCVNQQSKGNMA